jgi:hypothetical protein
MDRMATTGKVICSECGFPMDQVGPLDDPLDLWGCERCNVIFFKKSDEELILVKNARLDEFLMGKVQIYPPPLAIA